MCEPAPQTGKFLIPCVSQKLLPLTAFSDPDLDCVSLSQHSKLQRLHTFSSKAWMLLE